MEKKNINEAKKTDKGKKEEDKLVKKRSNEYKSKLG
jgi:hypothetical protein